MRAVAIRESSLAEGAVENWGFRTGTGEKQGRSPGEDCPRSYNRESLRAMGTVTNDPTEAQRLWEGLGRVGSGQEGAAH